ncbi:Hypothetical protein DHA2_151597 [Giardia duodenalis]|uniref:Uncharacterized protein n=1 Tax=Giardia intestinalis TaxID=5741 RepID=V6TK74_GIAIN|nr:Hypothetical protein DHA2_151597 [Giardia intestinalis]
MYATISPIVVLNDSTRILADLFYRLSTFKGEFSFRVSLRLGYLKDPMPMLSNCIFHQKCYRETTRVIGETYKLLEVLPASVFEKLLYAFIFPEKPAPASRAGSSVLKPSDLPPFNLNFRRSMQSELNSVIVTENHTDGVFTHKYIQHEFFSSTLVCGGATRLLVEQIVEDTRAISANTCEVYKWSRCIRLGDTLKDSDLLAQLPLQLVFELEETTFETRYLFRVEIPQIDELLEVGSRELSNIDYEADIQAAQKCLTETLFWKYADAILRLQAGVDRILSLS